MPARSDLATDPAVVADLANVRLGTAALRRALNRLTDDDLDGPSLLPSWTRRFVVSHVGYNARAIARLVDWAATGTETPMYPSPEARNEEIELGATLNPEALRNLVEHAAVDLDVRWRDLLDNRWDAQVRTAQGRLVPAAETVWMRSREVWLHAVDLDSGARFDQIPDEVLRRLIGDIHRTWVTRSPGQVGALVAVGDGDGRWGEPDDGPWTVRGPLTELAAWASGRATMAQAATLLEWSGAAPAAAPRWL